MPPPPPPPASPSAEELLPIAVLMDELKHDDSAVRLTALHRLPTIALALGPTRSRNELLPFLLDCLDDEDEILVAIAEEIPGLVGLVGGPDVAHTLLPPLEVLAAAEEVLVRDKAVSSICAVAEHITAAQCEQHLLPLLRRLASGEWFTSRCSSCGIFRAVYCKVPTVIQEELRKLYCHLSVDETPMVRRAAATALPDLIPLIDSVELKTEFTSVFQKIADDDQASVRLLAVEVFVALAAKAKPGHIQETLAPILFRLASESSWRVRYAVARAYAKITNTILPSTLPLIDPFAQLLRDSEPDVRTVAASQVDAVCSRIEAGVIVEKVLPALKELVVDTCQPARAAIASKIAGVAPHLGETNTVEHLLPLMLQLLRDEASEVRLSLICKLDEVNSVIGIDQLHDSLLPCIRDLSEDRQWRVRLAIIEYIPLLARQFSEQVFTKKLGPACVKWLSDKVFTVREAAIQNILKITSHLGANWLHSFVLVEVEELCQDKVSKNRLTAVMLFAALEPVLATDAKALRAVFASMNRLTGDPVPNVRLNVAKTFAVLMPILRAQSLDAQANSCLDRLRADEDRDVRFFAENATKCTAAAAAATTKTAASCAAGGAAGEKSSSASTGA